MKIGRFEKDLYIEITKEEYINICEKSNKDLAPEYQYDIEQIKYEDFENNSLIIWENYLDESNFGFYMWSDDFYDIIRECISDDIINDDKDFEIEIINNKEDYKLMDKFRNMIKEEMISCIYSKYSIEDTKYIENDYECFDLIWCEDDCDLICKIINHITGEYIGTLRLYRMDIWVDDDNNYKCKDIKKSEELRIN